MDRTLLGPERPTLAKRGDVHSHHVGCLPRRDEIGSSPRIAGAVSSDWWCCGCFHVDRSLTLGTFFPQPRAQSIGPALELGAGGATDLGLLELSAGGAMALGLLELGAGGTTALGLRELGAGGATALGLLELGAGGATDLGLLELGAGGATDLGLLELGAVKPARS